MIDVNPSLSSSFLKTSLESYLSRLTFHPQITANF
uniref:Uncharacterized protein n=1 Tax=Anguilla anguilla TaxID=7936 RepID=A0A0E9R3E0_ANGAN